MPEENNLNSKETKSPKKGTILRAVATIVLVVILAGIALAWIGFHHYYSKTSYEESSSTAAVVPDSVLENASTVGSNEDELLESINNGQTEAAAQAERVTDASVYNLLLIGVDRRDSSWNGNSDCMILISYNQDKDTVLLTSFMRDTGVNVDGYGLKKLNFSYAVGGGDTLVSTIESNFGISIDNYVWVDFDGVKAIIDQLGGVDMELDDGEVDFINNGEVTSKLTLSADHQYHLDGSQALVHARDRFSSGNDYARTDRQRNVIMAVISKLQGSSATELMKVADNVLGYVHHNIPEKTLLSLISNSSKIVAAEYSQQRIPYDGLYTSQNEFLIPDYSQTNPQLWTSIYGN